MEIKFENGRMKVKTEYNRKFIAKAHELQGKWESPYWTFPEENEDLVRDALLWSYGEDGRAHETVIVDLDLDVYEYGDSIKIGSVVIAKREYRDSSVWVDGRAVVISGGFCKSGGSRKNPCVTHEAGTILRVKNIPLPIYEEIKDLPGVKKVDLDLEENAKEKKAALEREREALAKRLAEIDRKLALYD